MMLNKTKRSLLQALIFYYCLYSKKIESAKNEYLRHYYMGKVDLICNLAVGFGIKDEFYGYINNKNG